MIGDEVRAQAVAFEKYSYATLKSLRDKNIGAIPVADYALVFPDNAANGVAPGAPGDSLAKLDARALGLRLFLNFSDAFESSAPGTAEHQVQSAQIGNWRLAGQLELALIELIGWTKTREPQHSCRLLAAANTYAKQGLAIALGRERLVEMKYLEDIGLDAAGGAAFANVFYGAYTYYKSNLDNANAVCGSTVGSSRASVRASIEEHVNTLVVKRVQAETDTTIAGINERLEPFRDLMETLEGDSTKSWNPELSALERDVLTLRSNLKFVAEDHLAVEKLVERITAEDFLEDVSKVLEPDNTHPLVLEVQQQSQALETELIDAFEKLAAIGTSSSWKITPCVAFHDVLKKYKSSDVDSRARTIDNLDQGLRACARAIANETAKLGGPEATEKYGAAIAAELKVLSNHVLDIMAGRSALR